MANGSRCPPSIGPHWIFDHVFLDQGAAWIGAIMERDQGKITFMAFPALILESNVK